MTKLELALIMQIIDTYTVKKTYNYGAPDTKSIEDVNGLKQTIIKKYDYIMKEGK